MNHRTTIVGQQRLLSKAPHVVHISGEIDEDTFAALLKQTGGDGFNGDTMGFVPESFWTAAEKLNYDYCGYILGSPRNVGFVKVTKPKADGSWRLTRHVTKGGYSWRASPFRVRLPGEQSASGDESSSADETEAESEYSEGTASSMDSAAVGRAELRENLSEATPFRNDRYASLLINHK